MRLRLQILTAVLSALCAAVLIYAPDTHARKTRKTHIVKSGESIARIADFYGVSQRDLRELNHLKKGRPLKLGQKLQIPNVLRVPGKRYKVKSGDTLAKLAEKFNRSVEDIAHANKMERDSTLRVGQTIVIPAKGALKKGISFNDTRPKPIVFLRVRTGEREKLQLYTASGKRINRSVNRLSYLSRDKIGNKVKRLNNRLVKMLQLLALEFPGKPIEIISGYRSQNTAANESQHAFGRAMDLRIPGVPIARIFRFCKTIPNSGCGMYPNDGFVHMDAREKSVSWVH